MDQLFGSSGSSSSPYSGAQADVANTLFSQSNPLLSNFLQQVMGLLQGGGPSETMLPMVQTAVTGARSGQSSSQAAAKGQMASLGLGSDPASQGILAGLNQSGNQAVAGIPSTMAASFLSSGMSTAQGGVNSAIGALGGAAGSSGNTQQSSGGLFGDLLSNMFSQQGSAQAFGSTLQGAGAAALPFIASFFG